jgi:hypothetical protein
MLTAEQDRKYRETHTRFNVFVSAQTAPVICYHNGDNLAEIIADFLQRGITPIAVEEVRD